MFYSLTETGEDVSQLGRVDEPIALLVKHLKSLDKVLHAPLLLLATARGVDGQELLETHSLATCEWERGRMR